MFGSLPQSPELLTRAFQRGLQEPDRAFRLGPESTGMKHVQTQDHEEDAG